MSFLDKVVTHTMLSGELATRYKTASEQQKQAAERPEVPNVESRQKVTEALYKAGHIEKDQQATVADKMADPKVLLAFVEKLASVRPSSTDTVGEEVPTKTNASRAHDGRVVNYDETAAGKRFRERLGM